MLEPNQVYLGDCLELMKEIDDKSIDMILTDLPYEKTARNHWDKKIPLAPLWAEYKRIIKNNGIIALTAIEPFSSELIMSNLEMFRYDLIWEKSCATGFLNANRQPLRSHEQILIFYKKQPTYNPQKFKDKPYYIPAGTRKGSRNYGEYSYLEINNTGDRFPRSVIKIPHDKNKYHPTQKPIPLFEWLIKTYTNENDLILDSCAGSGTTAIGCIRTNRRYILIEKDPYYYNIINERLEREKSQK